jgi:hypothetical protein
MIGLQMYSVQFSLFNIHNITAVTIEQVTYSTYHIQSFSNRLCQYE